MEKARDGTRAFLLPKYGWLSGHSMAHKESSRHMRSNTRRGCALRRLPCAAALLAAWPSGNSSPARRRRTPPKERGRARRHLASSCESATWPHWPARLAHSHVWAARPDRRSLPGTRPQSVPGAVLPRVQQRALYTLRPFPPLLSHSPSIPAMLPLRPGGLRSTGEEVGTELRGGKGLRASGFARTTMRADGSGVRTSRRRIPPGRLAGLVMATHRNGGTSHGGPKSGRGAPCLTYGPPSGGHLKERHGGTGGDAVLGKGSGSCGAPAAGLACGGQTTTAPPAAGEAPASSRWPVLPARRPPLWPAASALAAGPGHRSARSSRRQREQPVTSRHRLRSPHSGRFGDRWRKGRADASPARPSVDSSASAAPAR